MCGISFIQNFISSSPESLKKYKKSLLDNIKIYQNDFQKISHRGPDNSLFLNDTTQMYSRSYHMFWGFHRLSINGQTPQSNQPFFIKNCRLICNGEIYNFRSLIKEYALENEYSSGSDCEIIIHLYKKIGIRDMLRRLDGVFAFVLHDYDTNTTYVARDPVGVRSLFISGYDHTYSNSLAVSSELKAINECFRPYAKQFPPGCYAMYSKNTTFDNKNTPFLNFYSYYENVSISQDNATLEVKRVYNYPTVEDSEETVCENIATLFEEAVVKRLMSDRKVGALLSGGLDSSSVVAIMCRHMPAKDLNTYSIGLKGSTDLAWARKVADYLGTNHHEVCLSEDEFLDAIKYTIYQIESYDTTSVRASVPNYLVSKYIAENTEDCVIYCGDMSDEIFGSYRGFMKAQNEEEFKRENERMVRDVCYFDLLRSDKSISGAGLEARVPFADKKFLQYVMSIPPRYKMFDDNRIEKYIFRKAFNGILPDDILWRRKEAFSDGVSGHERSWFQIIRDYIDKQVTEDEYHNASYHNASYNNAPYDKESFYYRKIFNTFYGGCEKTIPYFWRHPFCEEKDPSARLLTCYKNTDL
jgi:asparagine synthase (glutamine-hydrolysing)